MHAQHTDEGLELLVASGGGHLHELTIAREFFRPRLPRAHWVSYGTPDVASRLAGEDVTVCHYPTNRNLPNALRNTGLAVRLLRELRPARVVSTGSGIAVPFLGAARALGIPAYYIESAARLHGPSLTGRMLQPVLRATSGLYSQYPTWGDGRWSYAGSVFDEFEPIEHPAPEDRPLRVAMSLGTQPFPFDRLIAAVDRITGDDDEVFAQVGAATAVPDHWDAHPSVPPAELERRFRTADVVVCHAGVGLVLTALQAGTAPLVAPRREQYGEHVDDHQQELAGALGRRGLIRAAEPDDLTRADLLAASAVEVRDRGVHARSWRLETAGHDHPTPTAA